MLMAFINLNKSLHSRKQVLSLLSRLDMYGILFINKERCKPLNKAGNVGQTHPTLSEIGNVLGVFNFNDTKGEQKNHVL